ncbi:acetyl-CoA carboxylase, carboxyltransferase subunit beta [Peptostreptococcus equinus]|uniref:Acetyl-coenzyme A carboxylase carboxyl transferase subunit beta n=1 Tax=Peptostreptococcus equinus TaxID=3003601 RepID=A0ABY7JQH9_9FIRM|nr:acetyl-CoA carboxylase, carboxyltransferase subunit beta [Peptostreptococcus sp. CBA3647]WAW14298.1 acetyl-CoA carboxylase, carboxyltransferase subunit beta [Peptostreptococcus sp. CBA3647]
MLFKSNKKIKYTTVSINLDSETVTKCPECNSIHNKNELKNNIKICPICGYYFKMTAMERIESIIDKKTFVEYFREWKIRDPLNFPNYKNIQNKFKSQTGQDEAVRCGVGKINGKKAVIAVMDAHFMMGSMGSTVGEKITKSIELSLKKKIPLIIFSASGGARMQEGMYSLMQMAKTSQALAKLDKAKQLFISVLTNPTTGGVSASFASLGDIIIAENKALIGFAGPRVISQLTATTLPEGFQKAEFLYTHGLVDMVCKRNEMKEILSDILEIHDNILAKKDNKKFLINGK